MRYLLIFLLLFSALNADDTKQKITIGAGAYLQTQPYKDVDTILLPSPVIFYNSKIFYVRWTRFGAYFMGEKSDTFSWGASLTAQPRVYGYKQSDSSTVSGMDEKKNSWEGGLALSASYKDCWIEVMLLTDILNEHDTWISKTEVGYDFKLGNFAFYPSLVFVYNSSAFMNYYYGVKSNEVDNTINRIYYNPHAALQIGAQTYIKYPINDKLSVLTNLKIDQLPKEATSSPIVSQDKIYSGLISLIYTLEF